MAETVGIAAAGAGFLSLAGQVLDGIVKLRGFIATVDSASREIHDLVHELDIFRGLLEEAGHRIQNSLLMGIDASRLEDAFTYCEKTRRHAEPVLKRLELNINRSKVTTVLRYPFKKKEIESMLLSVERGKTSLLLANQSFESSLAARRHAVMCKEHDLLLDRQRKINEQVTQVMSTTAAVSNLQKEKFAVITHDVVASTQASRVQSQDLKEAYAKGCREICTTLSQLQDQSKTISSSVNGQAQQIQCIASSVINAEHAINDVNARLESLALQIASQTQNETMTRMSLSFSTMPLSITFEQTSSRKQLTLTKTQRAVTLFTVRLPTWFLRQTYELKLPYATSGWPFVLNACRVVRPDSPFFNACRAGDIETIKVLLSSQQASIYDRTPCGTTAFRFAIRHGQLEVCKLLRDAGIFTQFDDNDYRKSLRALEEFLHDFTEHSLSLLRIAAPVNNPDRDWFIEYCRTWTDERNMITHADMELFSMLNNAHRDTAMLNLSHLKAYFEYRNGYARYGYRPFVSYIARVLSNVSTVHEITAARRRYAWIVYALASEIAHANPQKHLQIDADQWPHSVRQALCAVVHVGLNPHQISGKLESPWVSDDWYQSLSMTPLSLLCVETVRISVKLQWGTQSDWNKDLNARLQAWISGLYFAGINLLQYAESESAYFGCNSNSLAIPWHSDGCITVKTGSRPNDWQVSFWDPHESHARLFWCMVEGIPVVPRLTNRILEAYHLTAGQDLTCQDLPGSWPSETAGIAEALEGWLLRRNDDGLAEIEEDLHLLNESDFRAKWYRIDEMLRASAVVAR